MKSLDENLQDVRMRIAAMPAVEVYSGEVVCPACGGLGVVRYDVPLGDARFGKLFSCPEPECPMTARQVQERADRLYRYSHLPGRYGGFTFATFEAAVRSVGWQGKLLGYAAAQLFATRGGVFSLNEALEFVAVRPSPEPRWNASRLGVALTGDNGMGKTGLAAAITNALIAQGRPVLFFRLADLIADVQRGYSSEEVSAETRLEMLCAVPALVIDEFDSRSSDDRLEKVETLIRRRDALGLPTCITTNLASVEEAAARWGWRTGDILATYHWVRLTGAKLRQTNYEVDEL